MLSVPSICATVSPRRVAASRSITSEVCRPKSETSLFTSVSWGSCDSTWRMRGSQVRRSWMSSACSV